jgi:hypothetical protein
MEVLG